MDTVPGPASARRRGRRAHGLVSAQVAISEEDLNLINVCDVRGGLVDKGRCSTITTGLVSSEHNKGIEGLAWDPARALFYVAVEKYPMRVVSIGLDGRTTELFDAEALSLIHI